MVVSPVPHMPLVGAASIHVPCGFDLPVQLSRAAVGDLERQLGNVGAANQAKVDAVPFDGQLGPGKKKTGASRLWSLLFVRDRLSLAPGWRQLRAIRHRGSVRLD